MKDGSSLVVTPSSILSSVTHGPNADLSSNEGFKEVLEDSDNKPTMKKRISDSDDEEGDEHETEAKGMYSLTLVSFFSSPFIVAIFFLFLYIYT